MLEYIRGICMLVAVLGFIFNHFGPRETVGNVHMFFRRHNTLLHIYLVMYGTGVLQICYLIVMLTSK